MEHEGRHSSDSGGVGLSPGWGMESRLGLFLICKVGLAGAPTSWLAHLQTPKLPNMQQQVHQSRGPDTVCLGCQAHLHIGRLPSYNLGEPYAQPFSDSSAFLKQTDCQQLRFLVYTPSI